jgi:hypothetical protein
MQPQAGLKLTILLLQPPEFWDYRRVPSHMAGVYVLLANKFFKMVKAYYKHLLNLNNLLTHQSQ